MNGWCCVEDEDVGCGPCRTARGGSNEGEKLAWNISKDGRRMVVGVGGKVVVTGKTIDESNAGGLGKSRKYQQFMFRTNEWADSVFLRVGKMQEVQWKVTMEEMSGVV